MTFFIAEVSSNHNRSLSRIYKFIDTAADCGFNAIKFQLFKIDKLFSSEVLMNSPQHRARKKWELPISFIPKIKEKCIKKKIKFGITPFYIEDIDKIDKYIDFYKIASYELNWHSLLEKCISKKKKLIISTGMSNLKEVKDVYKVLKKNKFKKYSFLHCVSSYPADLSQLNLKAIQTLRKEFKCKVGWSDHSKDILAITRAIQKWNADEIELHLDLDRKGKEYKSGHCWLPSEIKHLIFWNKNIKKIDGNGIKKPSSVEKNERLWRADQSDGLRPIKSIRKKISF